MSGHLLGRIISRTSAHRLEKLKAEVERDIDLAERTLADLRRDLDAINNELARRANDATESEADPDAG